MEFEGQGPSDHQHRGEKYNPDQKRSENGIVVGTRKRSHGCQQSLVYKECGGCLKSNVRFNDLSEAVVFPIRGHSGSVVKIAERLYHGVTRRKKITFLNSMDVLLRPNQEDFLKRRVGNLSDQTRSGCLLPWMKLPFFGS